jgi:hypothetical protein
MAIIAMAGRGLLAIFGHDDPESKTREKRPQRSTMIDPTSYRLTDPVALIAL